MEEYQVLREELDKVGIGRLEQLEMTVAALVAVLLRTGRVDLTALQETLTGLYRRRLVRQEMSDSTTTEPREGSP